jgi:5-methyltetrahydropteroyltriglutamate--homocysteine methyltransferase
VVTNGELARSSWFGFFFERLEGFRLEPSHFKSRDADGASFDWPTCVACAHIYRRGPITLGEFERANALVRRALVKATMPAPSAFHFFRLGGSVDAQAYADVSGFFDDLIAVYRAELARAGCRYVQLDEVPIAMLCDPEVSRQAQAQGGDPATLIDTYIRCYNGSPPTLLTPCGAAPLPRQLPRPLDGRGRLRAGGGEALQGGTHRRLPAGIRQRARRRLPTRSLPAQTQDGRAGPRFLQERVPGGGGTTCCAASTRPPAWLPSISSGLSSQCGFASLAGGNALTEEEQWRKLQLVVDAAQRVWGRP